MSSLGERQGGVGKSSLSALLVSLAREGHRVGLLDADITAQYSKLFGLRSQPH